VQRLADQLSTEAAALAKPPTDATQKGEPGTVVQVIPGVGLVVASGGCPLLLREAQLEGKAAANGNQLLQQLQASPGDRIG
jgi:methionyl-tRNA formyltransferase